jgi:hypothetical protein
VKEILILSPAPRPGFVALIRDVLVLPEPCINITPPVVTTAKPVKSVDVEESEYQNVPQGLLVPRTFAVTGRLM